MSALTEDRVAVCWHIFILQPYLLITAMTIILGIFRPLGYERVYLPLCKVADTPFHSQGDDLSNVPNTDGTHAW